MKHLKKFNEWKLFNQYEDGDSIVNKLFNIIKNENIPIQHEGGFEIELDDKIYTFSKSGRHCWISKFDQNQKNTQNFILGKPESRYDFSKKLWKELKNLYKNQQNNISDDLDNLSIDTRTSKKLGVL